MNFSANVMKMQSERPRLAWNESNERRERNDKRHKPQRYQDKRSLFTDTSTATK